MNPIPCEQRWSTSQRITAGASYHHDGLGQGDSLLIPHTAYSSLGSNEADRLASYRALFSPELDSEAISDIRMALNQGQALADGRFIDFIERATWWRRGRPRKPQCD